MNLLQKLASSVTRKATDIGNAEIALLQNLNRGTPWGRAHQARSNAASDALYRQPQRQHTVRPFPPLGQLMSTDEPMQIQQAGQLNTYGQINNPQMTTQSMARRIQSPGRFNQQTGQAGISV